MIDYRAKSTHVLKLNLNGARLTMARHAKYSGEKATFARAKLIYENILKELDRLGQGTSKKV